MLPISMVGIGTISMHISPLSTILLEAEYITIYLWPLCGNQLPFRRRQVQKEIKMLVSGDSPMIATKKIFGE